MYLKKFKANNKEIWSENARKKSKLKSVEKVSQFFDKNKSGLKQI